MNISGISNQYIIPSLQIKKTVDTVSYTQTTFRGSKNFEQDYYKYQNAVSLNNQTLINTNNNYDIGRSIMNGFYEKYPKLDSFTMS